MIHTISISINQSHVLQCNEDDAYLKVSCRNRNNIQYLFSSICFYIEYSMIQYDHYHIKIRSITSSFKFFSILIHCYIFFPQNKQCDLIIVYFCIAIIRIQELSKCSIIVSSGYVIHTVQASVLCANIYYNYMSHFIGI